MEGKNKHCYHILGQIFQTNRLEQVIFSRIIIPLPELAKDGKIEGWKISNDFRRIYIDGIMLKKVRIDSPSSNYDYVKIFHLGYFIQKTNF